MSVAECKTGPDGLYFEIDLQKYFDMHVIFYLRDLDFPAEVILQSA